MVSASWPIVLPDLLEHCNVQELGTAGTKNRTKVQAKTIGSNHKHNVQNVHTSILPYVLR